jgi:hypothetical protein
MSNIDRLLPLEVTAQVLQLQPSTLRRWLGSGRISGHTLNAAPWSGVLDFATMRPTTYFRVREVLEQASQLGT